MPKASLKERLNALRGGLIRLCLPALVHPPGRIFRGEYVTDARLEIMRFLESWQSRLHGKVLDVGVGAWAWPRGLLHGCCEYTATDCFAHPNIDIVSDIHALDQVFSAETFDFVLCTDVFEHIPRPWLAARQIQRILRPGGQLLLTTPFNYRLHGNDLVRDYWRISADGLRSLLVDEAGFRRVEITATGHPAFPFSHHVVAQK